MRRKIRCDCKLRGLPEAQRVKVDVWLFEEGFTYEVVAGRMFKAIWVEGEQEQCGTVL